MRWLLLAGILAGCASTEPWIIQKGGDGQGKYLSTVIVVDRVNMAEECQNAQALACVHTNQFMTWGTVTVQAYMGVFTRAAGIAKTAYEIVAHEVCHYVADVHEIYPDPCHREDGGRVNYH